MAYVLAVPVPIALDIASRHLKQTVRAVICNNLLGYTSWAANLVAVLAIEQVFEGVEAIGCTRRSRVEGPLEGVELLGGAWSSGIAMAMARKIGRIRTGALDIGVRSQCSHRSGREPVLGLTVGSLGCEEMRVGRDGASCDACS